MSLAMERVLYPAVRSEDLHLQIAVIFTTDEGTRAALRMAASLASGWTARVRILVAQVVPFPLPLASPPVLIDFNERRFQALAEQSPVETSVNLYLCRDRIETLLSALAPRSLIVIGGRKRWWPTAETRLAAALRRGGHDVLFAAGE